MKTIFWLFVPLFLLGYAVAQNAPSPSAVTIPEVEKASKFIDLQHDQVVALWRKLALINAPSGHEDERAAAILDFLKTHGYSQAFRDKAGNVLSAPVPAASGAIVFGAHMDTVVQPGVHVTLREGHNEHGLTWTGPASGDDVSGVVALLAVAHALHEAGYSPKRPLIFLFTTNEEKAGTGSESFFKEHAKDAAAYIGVDSSPIDVLGSIADYGTGFYRLQTTLHGPGVHTIESFGVPSTTHALAIAVENLYKLQATIPQTPTSRRCWLNIGFIKAGTVENAMAADTYFVTDLRSNDDQLGRDLQKQAIGIIQDAAKQVGVQAEIKPLVFPPTHLDTPAQHRLRKTLDESYESVGVKPYTGYIGASDYIQALKAGVPGAGIGATNITKMHSAEEVSEVDAIFLGIKSLVIASTRLSSE